jgi:hypothetical protein
MLVLGKATRGMIVNPDRDQVAVKANMRITPPFVCLEGQADALVLREVRETAPSLEAEANGILNTTTNLESNPG